MFFHLGKENPDISVRIRNYLGWNVLFQNALAVKLWGLKTAFHTTEMHETSKNKLTYEDG